MSEYEYATKDDRIDSAVLFYQELALKAHHQKTTGYHDKNNNDAKNANNESAYDCEDCGEPIPEQRRLAIKGVKLCVCCKKQLEKLERIYL